MSFIGRETQALLLQKIVSPLPIVKRIYAYPRQSGDGSYYCSIHVVSDNGTWDVVVKRLMRKWHSLIAETYEKERHQAMPTFKWTHSLNDAGIPKKAQVLFVRQ